MEKEKSALRSHSSFSSQKQEEKGCAIDVNKEIKSLLQEYLNHLIDQIGTQQDEFVSLRKYKAKLVFDTLLVIHQARSPQALVTEMVKKYNEGMETIGVSTVQDDGMQKLIRDIEKLTNPQPELGVRRAATI